MSLAANAAVKRRRREAAGELATFLASATYALDSVVRPCKAAGLEAIET